MLVRSFIFSVFLLFGLCQSASATTRALLVGASDYDNSFGIADLKGPANDIQLIKEMLDKRGIDAVQMLLDTLGEDKKPTKANIMAAFARLARESEAGDLVYIHLSGHGSRQPDLNGDETDGLDEIFLPSDVKKTPQGSQSVPNALVDDEIGAALDKIRDKGASVWLVMDSCHSGGGFRDVSRFSASRNVDPETLGLNLGELQASIGNEKGDEVTSGPEIEGRGGILAFYAARSSEVAKEIDLSEGKAKDDRSWFGLFSSTLVKTLERYPNLTYRQLFQAVLSDINNNASLGVAKLQTPSWEGDLIDSPALGSKQGKARRAFLVKGDALEAGLVHGVQKGSLVGLIGSDLTSEDYLGYAQVEEVETRSSYLRPVARDCEPNANALCARSGPLLQEARFAHLIAQPRNQVIRFSPIFNLETEHPLKAGDPLVSIFSEELQKASDLVGISAAQSEAAYDVQIILDQDHLWFGPKATIGKKPVGLPLLIDRNLKTEFPKALSSILKRIIRAEFFAKSMNALASDGGLFNEPPVRISAEVAASRPQDLISSSEAGYSPQRECRGAFKNMNLKDKAALDAGQDLKQCDYLEFDAKGSAGNAMDVNRIHIDPKYCIHADYELVEGDASAKRLGDPMFICSDCPAPYNYSAGYERVFVIASKTQDNRESLNLTGLVENCFDDRDARSVSERSRDLEQGLNAVLQKATQSRSTMSFSSAVSDVWVDEFQWRTVPKDFVLDQ
ncbi:caspase family protein [uncultured Cohaesibacter sp.]|uniref:caspase family protein n=1 Tax=uncultured Cohaesibacter sp. TaxID=1002546 RepID=UPI00292E59B3|nr:caspase family protein [uncultured Cohaesibacter sp.]